MIEVVSPGARTSIERPLGTPGRAHEGVSRGGAFDPLAARTANRAAGASDDAAVLEVVLAGPTLRFHVDAFIAIAGAPFSVRLDDVDVAVPSSLAVRAGQVLTVAQCARGVRCAIAVRGGFMGEPGRVLARGERVDVGTAAGSRSRALAPWVLPAGELALRVTPAPQRAILEDDGLFSTTWTVDPASDRAGVRLRAVGGAPVRARRHEMITEGVTAGAVQLPPSGEPILLGVDRATTGGYPVVAHVAHVDLWLLGQLRPGAHVRLVPVSFADARALLA